MITLQKVLKCDSAQNAPDLPACSRQVADRCKALKSAQRSKVEAQRAIVINPFQLSASGFQLLCNAADGVFSAESFMDLYVKKN